LTATKPKRNQDVTRTFPPRFRINEMGPKKRTSMKLFPAGALLLVLATACSSARQAPSDQPLGAVRPASAVTSPSEPQPSPSASQRPPPPRQVQPIGFYATVHVIDAKIKARMKYSWRPGCPVPLKNLRLIKMSYWGFDGSAHMGEMVLNKRVVDDVLGVFRKMFDARFPIRRMRLVDAYRGNDDRSMAADNTSAFNCRKVTGGSSWSQHAYGWAIDINPVENPYISRSGRVSPPAGAKFADRSRRAKGMIHRGDVVYRAFRSIGWGWGGNWRSIKDYQHFSLTGR
jgi:hypothetical protein